MEEITNTNENKATLKYTISVEQYAEAFKEFQKKYVFPRNYFMTVGFAIILVVYIWQIIKDPTFQIAWFLSIVSFAAIVSMWFNVYSIRKKLIKSIKDIKDDTYTTIITDKNISIQTDAVEIDTENEDAPPQEVKPTVLDFDLDMPEVIENQRMFIIYLKKQMFYVIPKTDMNENEILVVSETFSNALGKRFSKK